MALCLGLFYNANAQESFENGVFPPSWEIINADNDYFTFHVVKDAENALDGEYVVRNKFDWDDWIVPPMLTPTSSNSSLTFNMKCYYPIGYNEKVKVYLSTTGNAASDFTTLLMDVEEAGNEWTEVEVDLSAYIGQDIFVGIHHGDYPVMSDLFMDSFEGPFSAKDNDLGVAPELIGQEYPSVGQNITYSGIIQNHSSSSIANASINIKNDDGSILATWTASESLAANASANYSVDINFSEAKTYNIVAEVNYDSDNITYNNTSESLKVEVNPGNIKTAKFGFGKNRELNGMIPMNFTTNASVSQSIFHEEQLGEKGLIKGVRLFYEVARDFTDERLQIYCAMTAEDRINDLGWVKASEMTKVFDGTFDLTQGTQGEVYIEFDETFNYTSDNLLMMYYNPLGDEGNGDNCFFLGSWLDDYVYCTAMNNSSEEMDLEGDHSGNVTTCRPKTVFYFDATNDAKIHGKVTEQNTTTAIADASIEIIPSATVLSNADGDYESQPLTIVGENTTFTVNATKEGYYPFSTEVTLSANEQKELNIELEKRDNFTFSGKVTLEDNTYSNTISMILERGEEQTEVNVDSEGAFSLEVYKDQNYSLTITADHHQEIIEDLVFTSNQNTDYNLVINPYPIWNLNGLPTEEGIQLAWQKPMIYPELEMHPYDASTDYGGVAYIPGYTKWVGNMYEVDGEYVITDIVVYGFENLSGSDDVELNVDIISTKGKVLATSPVFSLPDSDSVTISNISVPVKDKFYAMVHWEDEYAPSNYLQGMAPRAGTEQCAYIFDGETFLLASDFFPETDEITMAIGLYGMHRNGKTQAIKSGNSKAVAGYKIYRFNEDDSEDESKWEMITHITDINQTTFTDNNWNTLGVGNIIQYAVKAVYTDDIISEAYFSDRFLVTEVDESFINKELSIYPNPAQGNSIQLNMENTGEIMISNLQGGATQCIQVQKGTNKINIEHLTPGIYVVKVFSDNHQIIHVEKLIIQ